MIASKGARGCFVRAMHNGVNNGSDAAENSKCHPEPPKPWSAKRGSAKDGEGLKLRNSG